MKVFLSWSGETSKQVASALRDWLPNVIQAIDPWMSAEDIAKGARWSSKIASELGTTNAGIICVTQDNPGAPWLNFEAGALSKSVEREMVCPYLFRTKPSDVTGPLTEFQFSVANKEDTRRLIGTLNKAETTKPLPDGKLTEAFEMWWPNLERRLESIPITGPAQKTTRSPGEMIEEVLDIVRDQARTTYQLLADIKQIEFRNAYVNSTYPGLMGIGAAGNIFADSSVLSSAGKGVVHFGANVVPSNALGLGAINFAAPLRSDEGDSEPIADPESPYEGHE